MRHRVEALGVIVRDRWLPVLLLVISLYVVTSAVDWALAWRFRAQAPVDFFEYASVEYVGQDGDALLMQSTAVWRRPGGPILWRDVLRCRPVHDPEADYESWPIWTTQVTSAATVRSVSNSPRVVEWPFHPDAGRDWPDRPCFMLSTISADFEGPSLFDDNRRTVVQQIESPAFTPGSPSR